MGIQVLETDHISEKDIETIKNLKPDFFIVEDYGLILPQELLNLPKFAPINIHQSLLPKFRGPSPAPTAILEGEKVSGVTIIKMASEVDTGEMLAKEEYKLSDDETTDSLLKKLNQMGGELMVKIIQDYLDGKERPIPQNPKKATYTKRIKKADGYFDIDNPPSKEALNRLIRAYFPWPNAWTKWKGKIVKFLPENKLQMEGKQAVSKEEFMRGYPQFPLRNLL